MPGTEEPCNIFFFLLNQLFKEIHSKTEDKNLSSGEKKDMLLVHGPLKCTFWRISSQKRWRELR